MAANPIAALSGGSPTNAGELRYRISGAGKKGGWRGDDPCSDPEQEPSEVAQSRRQSDHQQGEDDEQTQMLLAMLDAHGGKNPQQQGDQTGLDEEE